MTFQPGWDIPSAIGKETRWSSIPSVLMKDTGCPRWAVCGPASITRSSAPSVEIIVPSSRCCFVIQSPTSVAPATMRACGCSALERFTRTDYNTLRYEATIDDPGAYLRPFKVGWNLTWAAGQELIEVVCTENNKFPHLYPDEETLLKQLGR